MAFFVEHEWLSDRQKNTWLKVKLCELLLTFWSLAFFSSMKWKGFLLNNPHFLCRWCKKWLNRGKFLSDTSSASVVEWENICPNFTVGDWKNAISSSCLRRNDKMPAGWRSIFLVSLHLLSGSTKIYLNYPPLLL